MYSDSFLLEYICYSADSSLLISFMLNAILCSCGVNFLIRTSTLSPTLNLLKGLTFSSAISETGSKASTPGNMLMKAPKPVTLLTVPVIT